MLPVLRASGGRQMAVFRLLSALSDSRNRHLVSSPVYSNAAILIVHDVMDVTGDPYHLFEGLDLWKALSRFSFLFEGIQF